MEIRIRLTQYDYDEKKTTVLADGKGFLLNDTLTYQELDNPSVRHEVAFGKDQIVLERHADIKSRTILPLDGKGESRIISPYGIMELETEIEEYYQDDEVWMVQYSIFEDGREVTHQRLVWELKGVSDE